MSTKTKSSSVIRYRHLIYICSCFSPLYMHHLLVVLLLLSTEILVQVCTKSCYGKSSLSRGIRQFGCTGTESTLIDCTHTSNTNKCGEDAGIVCCKHISKYLYIIIIIRSVESVLMAKWYRLPLLCQLVK